MRSKTKKQKPYIPIQTLLAYNATDAAVALLKKHGYEPKNLGDIQVQLTELYKNAQDKVEIEKAMVDIHPHLNIFKRYYGANPEEKKADKTVVEVSPMDQVNKEIKNTVVHDGYSSCEGSQTCNCMRGLYDGFDGTGKRSQSSNKDNLNTIAMLSIVAIVAMVLYKQ